MGQPQTREWTVDLRLVDGETGRPYEDDHGNFVIDPQAHREAWADAEAIQRAEGGAVSIVPYRLQQAVAEESLAWQMGQRTEWVNIGLHFEHRFAPPVRRTSSGGLPAVMRPASAAAQREATENGRQEPRPQLAEDAQAEPCEDDEMRDEDERAVAAELDEGNEPSTVMPQPTDPSDVHTEQPRVLDPAALMPKVG